MSKYYCEKCGKEICISLICCCCGKDNKLIKKPAEFYPLPDKFTPRQITSVEVGDAAMEADKLAATKKKKKKKTTL